MMQAKATVALYAGASDVQEDECGISDKLFYGREIYVRKMERLYYNIRPGLSRIFRDH